MHLPRLLQDGETLTDLQENHNPSQPTLGVGSMWGQTGSWEGGEKKKMRSLCYDVL